MLTTHIVTAREMFRNYKRVFERVKATNEPVVVVSHKEPQGAIVSMAQLKELEELKKRKSTKALLDLAGIIPKGSGLPADLSAKHDEYTWG